MNNTQDTFLKTQDTLKEIKGDESSKPVGLGNLLRSKRFEKDMSVPDVSKQLRLSTSIVEALEEEDYSKLPGNTFVRGYIRSYARLLNLPEDIYTQYNMPFENETAPSAPPITLFKKQASVNDRSIRWLSYLILLGLGALVVMWWHSHLDTTIPTDALGNASDVPNAQAALNSAALATNPPTQVSNNQPNAVAQAPTIVVQPISGFEVPDLIAQNGAGTTGQTSVDVNKQLNSDHLADGQAQAEQPPQNTVHTTKKKALPPPPAAPLKGLVTTRNLSMLESSMEDELALLNDKLHMDGFNSQAEIEQPGETKFE